jgi:hypothetical protein
MSVKCVSKCKGIDENVCTPDKKCKYINKTRKYCRLDYKYKMNKPNCNVTLKKQDTENLEKVKAQKRISHFIKTSKLFLNKICPTSGACITFGNNVDQLTDYFKGFTGFEYAVSPIKRIGKPSVNGFINEIEYNRGGYKAHAILKSSQKPTADNLLYEYIVGTKLINRKIKLFPCFLQTYGLYFYNTDAGWNSLKIKKPKNKTKLQNLVLQHNIDYAKACSKSKFASILIQHIHDAKTLDDTIDNLGKNFLTNDLLFVVFILYHALSSISTEFTHYDLHKGNVLLYKPKDGHYLEYHYHYADGSVNTFCSPYVPKIIDYGRAFFNNGIINSTTIYNKVCTIPECNPTCGREKGFFWFNPPTNKYEIYTSRKNESHDLRLLHLLHPSVTNIVSPLHTSIELKNVLDKVIYGVGLLNINKQYGTVENLDMATDQHIYNVKSAFVELKKAITNADVIQENKDRYTPQIKLGELHVYSDGKPMKYIHSVRI